jgi:hypothetical protein
MSQDDYKTFDEAKSTDPSLAWGSWQTFFELSKDIVDVAAIKFIALLSAVFFIIYLLFSYCFGFVLEAPDLANLAKEISGVLFQAILSLSGVAIGGLAVAVSVSRKEINIALEETFVEDRLYSQFVFIYGGMATYIFQILCLGFYSGSIYLISGKFSPFFAIVNVMGWPENTQISSNIWFCIILTLFFAMATSLIILKSYVWSVFINFRSLVRLDLAQPTQPPIPPAPTS